MLSFRSNRTQSHNIKGLLEDFESFCLGRSHLTPQQFASLNTELSVGAVLKVGKNRIERKDDGEHLIWTAPDHTEHDLGTVDNLNIARDYPGFHRTRSLSLGHTDVVENEVMHIPALNHNISKVKMKDGSIGYGPNYKIALRNAALRMHLKKEFERANPFNIWKMFYSNA
jgi:hypothetical protein